jgi:hypothetical protein
MPILFFKVYNIYTLNTELNFYKISLICYVSKCISAFSKFGFLDDQKIYQNTN